MNELEKTLPNPTKGLRFVKNEQGEWEQKMIDITLEDLEPKERGIIIVGHISHIKDEISLVLGTENIGIKNILVIEQDSISKDVFQGLNDIDQRSKQLEIMHIIEKDIMEFFDIKKEKCPDLNQRKNFYKNNNPKIQSKKFSPKRRINYVKK